MLENTEVRVRHCLAKFAKAAGREWPEMALDADLVIGLGMSSDEGLELVLDLCEEFKRDFPLNFNPVVHESGKRGRRLGELITVIDGFIVEKGTLP